MNRQRKATSPPKLAEWVLNKIFPGSGESTSVGDFEEVYMDICSRRGMVRGRLWYWTQVLMSLPPYIFGKTYGSGVMIKSYLKIAFRQFLRQKGYTIINMFGLSVGLACCLVVFLYVSDEAGFDNYHKDPDRIYRIAVRSESPQLISESATVSAPVAQVLREHFPQVEKVAQAFPVNGGLVERGEIKYYEETRIFVDPEIFDILTIPFLSGDAGTALGRPYTMVLSDRMAKKYFGRADPLGQTLTLNSRDYEITGVVADPPLNTHFKYDCFVSMKTLEGRYPFDRWFLANFFVYVKLHPHVSSADLTDSLGKIAAVYAPSDLMNPGENYAYFLQPVRGIHLHSHLRNELEPSMKPVYLYIFSAIGFFVLLIACMNFINLSTARSSKRAKEVGMRKVIGASRNQLVRQFFGESLVLIALALISALILVSGILPFVNTLTGKSFTEQHLLQPSILIFLLLLVIFVCLAASTYPALFLSAFQPAKALKTSMLTGFRGASLRKVLVVSQFAISTVLIAGTLIVYSQLNYMKNQYLGFDKEQKLIIPVRGMLSITDNYEAVKASFQQHPSVSGAAVSNRVIGQKLGRWDTELADQGETVSRVLNYMYVGPDFLKAYAIPLLSGRSFSREISTDSGGAYILNRSGAAEFGWSPEEALGKRLESVVAGEVVGVVEDFHTQGLQNPIEPLALFFEPSNFERITLNITTENLAETLAFIQNQWNTLFPGYPFEYYFLDTYFERQYQSEARIGRMFTVFTVLGVFIACLGLFGLASFTAEQKTKEIGVRKVLGAKVSEIVLLFSKEIVKWVLLANVVAWPVAYFVMTMWLENFAYRIKVSLSILLVSTAWALGIALLTVSYQSIKAACADPVNSLKYE